MTITVLPPTPQAETAAERQRAAAVALPQILDATADLPPVTWIVDATGWRLYGYVHDRDATVFHAYADRLGGTVTTGPVALEGNRPVHDLTLNTAIGDVPVQIGALVHTDPEGTTREAA